MNADVPGGLPIDGALLDARCVWVVDGGPTAPLRVPAEAPTCVVGVDRGLGHALRLGLRPHVAVGDFDSVEAGVLERSLGQWPDLVVERHTPHKAHSDLDLALSYVWGLNPERVFVVAGGGGRLDHLLTSVMLLGRSRYAALPLTAYVGDSVVRAATAGTSAELPRDDGNLLTLLAVGGTASLHTRGLRWNLTAAMPLASASTLGLSNEFVAPTASLRVDEGTVLAIQTQGQPLP